MLHNALKDLHESDQKKKEEYQNYKLSLYLSFYLELDKNFKAYRYNIIQAETFLTEMDNQIEFTLTALQTFEEQQLK